MSKRILMIAYACDPEGTGEHWLGWGWVLEAAKYGQVDLVTTPKARATILSHLGSNHQIRPHFVEISPFLRRISEKLGGFAAWVRKYAWQRQAWKRVRQLHADEPFDIVHQTTFHTFRIPFLAAQLPIPSVWGPIAGGESVPPGFGRFLDSQRGSEALRAIANRISLWIPSVRKSLCNSSVIWASNGVTADFLGEFGAGKTMIVHPNALRIEDADAPQLTGPAPDAPFTLLYVGNCVETRALPIVLEALQSAQLKCQWRLQIVGTGPAISNWKKQVQRMRLCANVEFIGPVQRSLLDVYYSNAHVLVFPAMRDAGGSALLEAMSKGLPVACLDWGGPGEMVDEGSGLRIPVTSPEATVTAFARGLERLAIDNEWRQQLACNGLARARTCFKWEAKGEILRQTYNDLISQ